VFFQISTLPNKPTLYERLGGVHSIATVADDFIGRIMADARLNANPLVNEAHHRVSPAGFKYLATKMVCGASGGPQRPIRRRLHDLPAFVVTRGVEYCFINRGYSVQHVQLMTVSPTQVQVSGAMTLLMAGRPALNRNRLWVFEKRGERWLVVRAQYL
jgi:hypothetical protein